MRKILSKDNPIDFNFNKNKLIKRLPKKHRAKQKDCIPVPFLNCEKIYLLQQKKLAQIISILKDNTSVDKIIIFGSSTINRCHINSDVDVFVNLSSPTYIFFAACDFVDELYRGSAIVVGNHEKRGCCLCLRYRLKYQFKKRNRRWFQIRQYEHINDIEQLSYRGATKSWRYLVFTTRYRLWSISDPRSWSCDTRYQSVSD